MREKLLQVLNNKLDDIKQNIASLEELNTKLAHEEEELDYIEKMISLFNGEIGFSVLNFIKLDKENFEHILNIVDGSIKALFDVESCNYDGLIYLIEGINNGVSLTLTEEQENAITSLFNGLKDKKEEKRSTIVGLQLLKTRYAIDDIEVLEVEKEKYLSIIDKMSKNSYIEDTDKIMEAMAFSNLSEEEIIGILSYILEYNAHVHSDKGNATFDFVQEEKEEEPSTSLNFGNIPSDNDFKEFVFNPEEESKIDNDISLDIKAPFENNNEVSEKDVMLPPLNDDFGASTEEDTYSIPNELPPLNNDFEIPVEENSYSIPDELPPFDMENAGSEETPVEETPYSIPNELPPIDVDNDLEKSDDEINHPESLMDAFNTLTPQNDYDLSLDDVNGLFDEYGLNKDLVGDELREGDIENYRIVLQTLKDNDILSQITNNKNLFHEIMLYSGKEEIDEVLRIIREDLSVDDSDYKITLNIAINTIPTIFIRDGGSYENFVKNTALFKEIGINLINLFDFSKEIFIVSHDVVRDNYEIVKKYNVNIDHKNAKYLLMLPNIDERMDYYVESVYPDKTKNNEVFDGITYINDYAVKLNNVCDLVIKRLRFASERGRKVFGSKPKSLASEITNLKVDSLEIDDIYLAKFFNNEFDGLTFEETREFTKLIHNSSNVGNYSDELSILDKYRDNIRYVINGINISYNKVNRIYNILRSYGINNSKALHFAICYNLVITKEEYSNLKNVIDELGGSL